MGKPGKPAGFPKVKRLYGVICFYQFLIKILKSSQIISEKDRHMRHLNEHLKPGLGLKSKKYAYRISANSFRGNYSFLNLALCTVTFDHST